MLDFEHPQRAQQGIFKLETSDLGYGVGLANNRILLL